MTPMNQEARVTLVTGASSGIGRATAIACARRGDIVVAVARREPLLQRVIDECREHAPDSLYLAGDLAERGFAEFIVDETARRFGRLDVLINNAASPLHRDLYSISIDEAEASFRLNFNACLWTTFTAIPYMLSAGSGTIVNVSSFATKVIPTHESIYAAAKSAMNGLSEGLWNDLHGSGIHVCLVHPGPIDTEIWEKIEDFAGYAGRLHPPETVARGILDAIERRRFEVVLPRRDPALTLARVLRRVAPRLVRWGARRQDPLRADALERARARARSGERLGR